MPQIFLSTLVAIGSLVGLSALWVGVLSYGIRPNVSTLGLGQLMSLIALPPLGVWGASTAAFVWRKRSAEQQAKARAADEQAATARQAAAEAEKQQKILRQRQQPYWVRASVLVEAAPAGEAHAELNARLVALAQAAWAEVRAQMPEAVPDAVLLHAPAGSHAAFKKIVPGVEMVCFDHAADLLQNAFARLEANSRAALVVLAVDSPLAVLDAAPTRLNPETLEEEPDIDLPLRGEAGQAAVALWLDAEASGELPALARLHRPGVADTLNDALMAASINGKLVAGADADAPPVGPTMLAHTAGISKEGGAMLAALAMNLPAFAQALDPIDDALNVPHAVADYGIATFWVGVMRAIEHAGEIDEPALCVDCISSQNMLPLVVNPATSAKEIA